MTAPAQPQFALTPEHIAYKRKIARVGNAPLFEMMTTGGLYINVLGKNGAFDVVGTGSHRAISRYITEKKLGAGNIVWDELSKADWLPYECIDQSLFVKYEELTDRLQGLQGIE